MNVTTNPQKVEILQQIDCPQIKQNPTSPTLKDKIIKYRCCLLVSFSIITLIITSICVTIYLLFLQPTVTIKSTDQLYMPDGSRFIMVHLRLSDINIFQPSQEKTLFATFQAEDSKGRRLQGSANSFYIHSYNKQIGTNIRMSPQGNTSFFVNEASFSDYAEKELAKEGESIQRANETTDKIQKNDEAENKPLYSDLGQIFTKALEEAGNKNMKVHFINQTMANLKINPDSHQMEFDLDSSKRSLTETEPRRVLFIGKILKVATKIVPKVASFFVETVRKYGPLIGKVVGGVAGGILGLPGGPAGVFQGVRTGMDIGGMVGSAASMFVKACIPQGSLRISCTPSSIGSAMSQFGTSSSFSGLIPNLPGTSSTAFNSFFGGGGGGGFGGAINKFVGSIPQKALSTFGFGSIFPKA